MEDRLVSLAEAAAICGRAKSTLTRARTAGKFPNTQQDNTGKWLIPISDLIAARLLDHVTPTSTSGSAETGASGAHTADTPSCTDRRRWSNLCDPTT